MSVPRVKISSSELRTGITNPSNIQEAVKQYHINGFVILENVIDAETLKKLAAKMQADVEIKSADPETVFNQGVKPTNFSMPPPLQKEYLFEDVWANRHAVAVMEHLIGPRPKLTFASTNTSLPTTNPTARQAVHIDTNNLLPSYPLCIQASLYLSTVSPLNGSTELWPTSHLSTSLSTYIPNGRGWIQPSFFKALALNHPPLQPVIPCGSILLRDLRTWHSGMPNLSPQPRIMLTFTYFPQWYSAQMGVTLPSDCKSVVKGWKHVDAVSCTRFEEGEVDYLSESFEKFWVLNYTQDPELTMGAVRAAVDVRQGREPNAEIPVTSKNYWTPPRRSARKRKVQVTFVTDVASENVSKKGRGKGMRVRFS